MISSRIIRQLLRNTLRTPSLTISSLNQTLLSSPPPPPIPTPTILTIPTIPAILSSNFTTNYRTFSSCSSSGAANIVSIKSEEEFNASLSKVQSESVPAIFYFTAVWCGPCRFISPVIEELSQKYNVTTYKVDIDLDGLGSTLSKLNITSVPTFHFFQNGKKASEMIGAHTERLRDTMEELYGQD